MISRRSFLGAILGAAAAPAIVRADSLMRVVAPKTTILVPGELGRIEGVRFVASSYIDFTSKALRAAERSLLLERFGEPKPMPLNPNGTLRFRRYADTHLLVPRDISADLINPRKTA